MIAYLYGGCGGPGWRQTLESIKSLQRNWGLPASPVRPPSTVAGITGKLQLIEKKFMRGVSHGV